MAGIFTRPKLTEILQDEALTLDERLDRIMSMRGKDLDDGYVTKALAKESTDSAVEAAKAEWEKNAPKPNILESEEYKALRGEYDAYKARQNAKGSEDYKEVNQKYFDMVYDMVDRKEGAKAEAEQIAEIKEKYPEMFSAPANNPAPKNTPQYSQQPGMSGTNQATEEEKIYKQLSESWK